MAAFLNSSIFSLGLLARKFGRDIEQLARTAILLADRAEMVQPKRLLHVFKNEAENRVLGRAVAGSGAAIVTGDRELLDQRSFEDVAIISLRAYLNS
jgi:predicted nucleic acid-binding protein